MSMNIRELLRGFNEAVNETALAKSDFYRKINSEIKATVSRRRPLVGEDGKHEYYELEIVLEDLEGNPLYDKDGKIRKKTIKVPVMEKVSLDDMIPGIFSLGSRGSKIHNVPDAFIRRIARKATAARVLGRAGYKHHSEHLQELTRHDVKIVIKTILPDLTRVSMPAHMKLAESANKTPEQIAEFQRQFSPSTDLTKQQGIQ